MSGDPRRLLALQRAGGNAAVSALVSGRPTTSPAGGTPGGPVGGTPLSPLAVQREPGRSAATVTVDLGWVVVTTNAQLAAGGRVFSGTMESDAAELEPGSPAGAEAAAWIQTIKDWLPYLDAKGTEPIEPSIARAANRLLQEGGRIRAAIHDEKLATLRSAWRQAQRAAEASAEEAEALEPRLADGLRTAFRKGSSSTLKNTVGAVKSALSIGRNLRSLSFDISKELLKLSPPSGVKVFVVPSLDLTEDIKIKIIDVGKYTNWLTKLNRGLNMVNIALTVLDRSKRATEVEQGMKDLNDAVNIGTDLGSLMSLPPHFSLYATMYLKPMLKAITAQLSYLTDQLSEVNRTAVAVTGNLMYPGAEPGGQAMFDFMVAVMHASSPGEVPAIGGEVAGYLYEHHEKLAAGTEADLPTSGHWFWQELDSDRGRGWIFDHRSRVWAMFYGSTQVPNRS